MSATNSKTSLTPAERQALKGRAHRLNPVVMIAEAGLSESVLTEIERNLAAHGLIKIRVFNADRDEREQLLAELCAATGAQPVQHIGKIFVVYREKPLEETSKPAPAKRPAARSERTTAKPPIAARARGRFTPAPEGRPGRAPKRPPRSAAAKNRAANIRRPRER